MYYEFDVIVNVLLGFYVFFGRVVVSVINIRLFVMVVVFIYVKYRFVISMFCLNNFFI